jgi:hypothetical protein
VLIDGDPELLSRNDVAGEVSEPEGRVLLRDGQWLDGRGDA